MECDFCEQPAVFAAEALENDFAAYLCRDHLPAWFNATHPADWFEPAAIGAELDAISGLPAA